MDIKIDNFLYTTDGGKAEVNHSMMARYLEEVGFRCSEIGEKGDVIPVRIVGRIIKKMSPHDLTQWLRFNVFAAYPKHDSMFAKNPSSYFGSAAQIKYLKPIDADLLKDTHNTAYIPFKNGMVCITKDNVEIRPMDDVLTELDKCVYEEDIIQRDFEISDTQGDFEEFCHRAATAAGKEYLMAAIGYMLHRYKTMANAKLIVFSDIGGDISSTKPNGGCGKSLIATKALSQIRKQHFIDGKQFNKKSEFKFQGITEQHSIIAIEDIDKDFDSHILFNMTTGDMSIRSMYTPAKTIKFENSAKIIVTANRGIALNSGSEQRRVCVIGFSDYYNHEHTPMHDFKKTFFSNEWERHDWVAFYNFMVRCIQTNFTKGLRDFGKGSVKMKHVYEKYSHILIDKMIEPHIQELLLSKHKLRDSYAALIDCMPQNTNDNQARIMIDDIMDAFGYVRHRKVIRNDGRVYWYQKKGEPIVEPKK